MYKFYLQDIKQRHRSSNENFSFLTPLFPLFLNISPTHWNLVPIPPSSLKDKLQNSPT